jgi:[ribosomal protein S5]-alanine N-acetyltransferase
MARQFPSTSRVRLVVPTRQRERAYLDAVRRSTELHRPWVHPPSTPTGYRAYLRKIRRPTDAGFFVVHTSGELAGMINVNEIVRGVFKSAYLGYFAFVPFERQGHMHAAMALALTRIFGTLRLHRVEANIQPGNRASIRLVSRLGFRREGRSERYLKIGGRWRDHERWALTVEAWRATRRRHDAPPARRRAPR